jgi:hypothetical protein
MRLTVVAAIASGALALSGCQLVFGLGDYVDGVDTTGAGGGGSTSGGAGGESASTSGGGNPSTTQAATTTGAGGGDACTCVGGAWKAYEFITAGTASDTQPTSCGNGGELLLLHPGDPSLVCSECTCTKGGCELPAVNVYDGADCSGSPTPLMPSASCTTISKGSAQLAGPIGAPLCQPSGGVFDSVGFDRFVALCGATTCDGGDDCDDGERRGSATPRCHDGRSERGLTL